MSIKVHMRPQYISTIAIHLITALALGGANAIFAFQLTQEVNNAEAKDWQKIIVLHQKGQKILQKIQLSPRDDKLKTKRKDIYYECTVRLRKFINTYILDRGSIKYLRAIYRLGVYLELCEMQRSARGFYKLCTLHPLINDPEAIYDERPIALLVKERLEALPKNINQIVTYGASGIKPYKFIIDLIAKGEPTIVNIEGNQKPEYFFQVDHPFNSYITFELNDSLTVKVEILGYDKRPIENTFIINYSENKSPNFKPGIYKIRMSKISGNGKFILILYDQ